MVPLSRGQIENVHKGDYYVLFLLKTEKVRKEAIPLSIAQIEKVLKAGSAPLSQGRIEKVLNRGNVPLCLGHIEVRQCSANPR